MMHGVPAGHVLPPSLAVKVLRSWDAPVEALVARGVITSGEALARMIPQLTASVRAASIADPALRRLYRALYASFRRRRSLLLLNLQRQVKLEELPWVQPLDARRLDRAQERMRARQLLGDLTQLTLRAFPEAIIPNKLVQEFSSLADSAALDLPLVEELAADIFMDDFSEKFLRAAQRAATLLEGTLYARYYDLPCARIRSIDDVTTSRYGAPRSPAFAALCRERAQQQAETRVESDPLPWSVARNGTIVEQAQVLTTHNLAVLFESLDLAATLGPELGDLARRCFLWLCRRLQFRSHELWHAKLLAVKNAAYAWRQMVFYLSFLPGEAQVAFVDWAEAELSTQRPPFPSRFAPAVAGLRNALQSEPGTAAAAGGAHRPVGVRPFLGWATGTHWLLA
jgi:hypothetical protein